MRGYPGTAGIALAMERGEVQGMIGDDWASIKANKASWLREKKVRILMQMTAERHADLWKCRSWGFRQDEDNRRVLACSSRGRNMGGRSWRRRARRSGRGGLS